MDIPSLFMIPSAVSSGKVHSVFPNSTDADFDFNRDSSATRVNSQGLIETVGYFGTEKLTGFTNGTTYAFTTFTTSGNNITSAIVSSAFAGAVSNAISVTSGQIYRVTFDYTKNSGNDLRVVFSSSANGAGTQISNNHLVSSSGSYSFDFTITSTTTGYLQMGTGNSGHSLNVSISNVSVKEIQGDRARLNYEIEGGLVNTKCSLLLEPQSTNSNTYSNDFTQTYWSKQNGSSVSSNQTKSPEGVVNADKLISANATSEQYLLNASISTTSGDDITVSCFVKKLDYDYFHIRFTATGGVWVAASVWYNIDNGTLGTVESGITAKIEDYGNGWYRCVATRTATGTGSGRVRLQLASSDNTPNVVGDGTKGTFIYGAQWEVGSYCTSLIPTNGSVQTRANETCNGAGTSSIFESSEGILYAEIAALANDGSVRYLGLSDGSSGNRAVILNDSSNNNIRGIVSSGGTKYADFGFVVSDVTTFNKVALKWKANDFQLWINGVKRAADLSGSSPIGLDRLSFDLAGGNTYDGKIRDIRVYNTKEMTDSEVDILLTKITS
jgi:hypothetical protein